MTYAYHAAPRMDLPSIMKQGLVPRRVTAFDRVPGPYALWVTTRMRAAAQWGQARAVPFVVLRFALQPGDVLEPDLNSMRPEDAVLSRTVLPDELSIFAGNVWNARGRWKKLIREGRASGQSSTPERTIIAYHGGPVPIRRFDPDFSAQGVFWFSEDLHHITGGESGASSTKYIMTVKLKVQKTAGWDEYERYGLGELVGMGYDSIHLDDDWVVFDPRRIQVVRAERKGGIA